MLKPFMRQVTDALMPEGAIWNPALGGDFDRLLEGVAENQQAVLDELGSLAYIRNPKLCPEILLSDLEREFGISPDNTLTVKERRAALAAIRYKKPILATVPKLQRVLNMAGFGYGGYGLIVTPNASPAADPSPIVTATYAMTAHDFPSIYCAGNSSVAYCYYNKGYYLVSGDTHDETIQNTILSEPYWPLVFFIGGKVTRGPDGRIIGVATVSVPARRRQELHRLILRIKPVGIWAAMLVQYT